MARGKSRTKVFRDPIHGDISVGPVQRAVIDSDLFQRLRYIRQNGLLHYIFPGAVHTRFAHSIGTMRVAQRVFKGLFAHYRPAASLVDYSVSGSHLADIDIATHYVGLVFELSALCHDIGHCAFSHSIEHVTEKDFFLPLDKYVTEHMDMYPTLTNWWSEVRNKATSAARASEESGKKNWMEKVSHEELGMLFIVLIFSTDIDKTLAVTLDQLYQNAKHKPSLDDLRQDVLRMIRGESWLDHSAFMKAQSEKLVRVQLGALETSSDDPASIDIAKSKLIESLLDILHGLISGTVDVDRFDYLVRDSRYAGTTCGIFDLDLIINSLALRLDRDKQQLVLCIYERAEKAIDDFLWSRYQFYAQVLNHKGNVLLNALFPEAIIHFIQRAEFPPPHSYQDFLTFSDDMVLSQVRKGAVAASVNTPHHAVTTPARARQKVIVNAFLRKSLPLHLGAKKLGPEVADIETQKTALSQKTGIALANISHAVVTNKMFKDTAVLPQIIRSYRVNGGSRQESIEAPQPEKNIDLAVQYEVVHFYEIPAKQA